MIIFFFCEIDKYQFVQASILHCFWAFEVLWVLFNEEGSFHLA